IQAIRIERDRRCNLLDDVEHDRSSLWTDRSAVRWSRVGEREPAIIHQRGAIRPCPGRAPRRRLLYFGWMPAIVTASPHKAMSAAIIAANSLGVLPSGSTPNAASRSAKVASLTARDTSFRDPVDGLLRHRRRRHQPVPSERLKSRKPRLGEGGNIGDLRD